MTDPLTFERHPDRYQHWRLEFDAPVARLTMSVDPAGGALGSYELKLNSYDIGVDIELADVVRRLRFEHPEISCVIVDSALDNVFCAGANIGMLAAAPHAHKVNFCKFTNETRLEIEEASRCSGLRFLAALNGACSGGGYELALACDSIILVDDRSSAVSLPEVPLLGVLPGTGGLTRLTDKRHVRKDRADVFATKAEGLQGEEALRWGLVDKIAAPSGFDAAVKATAEALAATSHRNLEAQPLPLDPLQRDLTADTLSYRWVTVRLDRQRALAELTIRASSDEAWPLTVAREFDDAVCHLRFNEPELGTILIRSEGKAADVMTHDTALAQPDGHGQTETALLWKRVLSRLDLTSRSLIAVVEPGSCFAGILAEVLLAADRSYMLDGIFEDDVDPLPPAKIQLGAVNGGAMPMANDLTRLASRFWGDDASRHAAEQAIGRPLDAAEAIDLGLVTVAVDDLDWHDEVRLAIEERATYSPDALTGMEANHRFCGPETMATKIFSRLSAWQNWIFIRPNASGPVGALLRYGTGSRPDFDRTRT